MSITPDLKDSGACDLEDYVECMWRILQHTEADDFVIATGEMHSVRTFTTMAFSQIGITLEWKGTGIDEKGYDAKTDTCLVEIDPRYFRPCEVEQLLGDPTKAKSVLGWNPRMTSFDELVKLMVNADMERVLTGKDVDEWHG